MAEEETLSEVRQQTGLSFRIDSRKLTFRKGDEEELVDGGLPSPPALTTYLRGFAKGVQAGLWLQSRATVCAKPGCTERKAGRSRFCFDHRQEAADRVKEIQAAIEAKRAGR